MSRTDYLKEFEREESKNREILNELNRVMFDEKDDLDLDLDLDDLEEDELDR